MGIKEARFSGQMTVEFVVAFPAMMAIALIAVNAVLFFSDCASFDRLFRNSVCAYAASPAYEQGVEQSCSLVETALNDGMGRDNLQIAVAQRARKGERSLLLARCAFSRRCLGKEI